MMNKGQFNTVKGSAQWRDDHAAVYKHAAFLVKGKGAAERKNEWDLFTVLGSQGARSVMPTLKSLATKTHHSPQRRPSPGGRGGIALLPPGEGSG